MAESVPQKYSEPSVGLRLVDLGKEAFNPSVDPETRELNVKAFQELIDQTETWSLLAALNSLIKPNVLPTWLREPLLHALTLLPLRSDGVRGTLEFVFFVHPSSQTASASRQQPEKEGAGITHDAVAAAIRLLSTVPASLSAEAWYIGIAPQLLRLLDGADGQDLAKVAAQVIGFGVLGKRQMGAPGSAGWNAFVQPLLEQVNPSLKIGQEEEVDAEIVDLRQNQVQVGGEHLAAALGRLNKLVLINSSPGLCKRLLKPISVQLWVLSSIDNAPETVTQKYCTPANRLLHTFFKLFGKVEEIQPIIHDFLSSGCASGSVKPWVYHIADESTIEAITVPQPSSSNVTFGPAEMMQKAEKFVQLTCAAFSSEETFSLFLFLLQRWVTSLEQQLSSANVKTKEDDVSSAFDIHDLAKVVILQKLMEVAPDKLVTHISQLIEVICQILEVNGRTALGDELMSVILSLLNMVITAPSFKKSDVSVAQLRVLEASLASIENSIDADISTTASNLAMLLRYRDEVSTSSAELSAAPPSSHLEDRRAYNLAMSYITGDTDNPPPVVSEGLDMLSTLITNQSPVLDIPAVIILMSSLLKSNEDYVNLRVIKIFTQLANRHPKSTIQEILDHYLDPQEASTTDTRLRFGEALLQVVERLGQAFAGDVARQTVDVLVWVAGRRAHRPRAKAKQARDEKLARLKRQKATQSYNDNDVDDDIEERMAAEAEKDTNEIMSQITRGWESRRGSEDVRMRASALSILGMALEINVVGIGPALVSNVLDLCVSVLTAEREIEYGILRRAAVIAILGFVRALHQARESGRSIGFGLTDSSRGDLRGSLEYVAATDNDGLVQQHARDVVECLETFHISSLLAPESELATSQRRLAGLNVDLGDVSSPGPRQRRHPGIEEVE